MGTLTSHRFFITCARACETGLTVYRPYPRRIESPTVCRCFTKASLSPQLLDQPVSLLPAASKICERVALNQLMTYMTTKKRLSEHQSGNKKLHSCETLNVMITDKALEAMDAKKVTLVVLLDLSKAFDSIDHVTLLAKLQALGDSRASLDWFKSYLSERLQCVRIEAETSSLQGISHGVLQGSILGSALFTIYLNNIPSIPDVCSLESYVDDSKLYLSFPVAEASNMIQQINKDLEKIAS